LKIKDLIYVINFTTFLAVKSDWQSEPHSKSAAIIVQQCMIQADCQYVYLWEFYQDYFHKLHRYCCNVCLCSPCLCAFGSVLFTVFPLLVCVHVYHAPLLSCFACLALYLSPVF